MHSCRGILSALSCSVLPPNYLEDSHAAFWASGRGIVLEQLWQNGLDGLSVRIAKASDAAYVDKLFRSLRVSDPHCRLTITGGINRPPMERKPGTVALFKKARSLAAQLGFALEEASTGGGSDGNFTAGLGIPTLDGLGGVGDGAHATHEHILISELPRRAALIAGLIERAPLN